MSKGDGAIWPMTVMEGGEQYGFCPGKAQWDETVKHLFRSLLICADTGTMWEQGGIKDQPDWFVDLLSWFLPRYDTMKFLAKADMILGGSTKKGNTMPGPARKQTGALRKR